MLAQAFAEGLSQAACRSSADADAAAACAAGLGQVHVGMVACSELPVVDPMRSLCMPWMNGAQLSPCPPTAAAVSAAAACSPGTPGAAAGGWRQPEAWELMDVVFTEDRLVH